MTRPDHTTDPAVDPAEDSALEQPAVEPAEEPDVPLNRAERRAKQAKQAAPSHVGPRSGGGTPRGRGPRSASKRP